MYFISINFLDCVTMPWLGTFRETVWVIVRILVCLLNLLLQFLSKLKRPIV